MSDPTFNSVTIRRDTASAVEDLLTLDSVSGTDGNGSALSFIDNSATAGLYLTLGRIGTSRVDGATVRMDLGVARDPTVSSGDDTPALLSLLSGTGGLSVTTTGPLAVGGALSVAGAATLSGGLRVTGNLNVTGAVDGRDVSADGAKLDQHLARTDNPHATTAAQIGAPISLAGVRNPGGDIALVATGALTFAADDAANRITLGESHSARTDNPHATTAAQVGALPASGGTISGSLTVNGNVGIGMPNPGQRLDVNGLVRSSLGFVFPDGTAQATAVRVMAGAVQFGEMPGQGPRTLSQNASLTGFGASPTVIAFLSGIDCDRNANLRISTAVANVSSTGFTVTVSCWADTHLYYSLVSWLAIGSGIARGG